MVGALCIRWINDHHYSTSNDVINKYFNFVNCCVVNFNKCCFVN